MALQLKTPKSHRNPIRVALTTGHVKVIGYEFEPVEQMFMRDALGQGAIVKGVPESELEEKEAEQVDVRHERIKQCLLDMIEHSNKTDTADEFTAAGLPSLKALSKRVGFNVPRDDAYAIWAEVDPGKEDGDDDGDDKGDDA